MRLSDLTDISTDIISPNELADLTKEFNQLVRALHGRVSEEDTATLEDVIAQSILSGKLKRDTFGLHPLSQSIATTMLLCDSLGADRAIAIAILLHEIVHDQCITIEDVRSRWGDDIATIVRCLLKTRDLYATHAAAIESENFKRLLLTLAEDIRVIIIMIVARVVLMRSINHHPNQDAVRQVAMEAAYLYAPLAHRLGLYTLKSELEDLSLKYTDRETYTSIAHKLNETKARRDAYIDAFIAPVKQKLIEAGLHFDIKGRTKSIYSIWNKMKRQKTISNTFTTSSQYESYLTPLSNAKKPSAGWLIRWSPTCTNPIPHAPRIGYLYLRPMVTNHYIPLSVVPTTSLSKYRYAPDEWTKSPKKDWPPIGDTRALKAKGTWMHG